MSYDKGVAYREYAFIEGINLLVNMTDRNRDDKEYLKNIHANWIKLKQLAFADQIELIYGTATDKGRCRYMVNCINKLNGYMMSKYPDCENRIRMLVKDVLDSINIAIMGDIHIWKATQVDAIQAAFMSGRVTKPRHFYEPKKLEEKEREKKVKVLEFKPD